MGLAKQNGSRRTRGESMIMVTVMLMVFLILGGAVLTASASASATASARVIERQAYYYGRSMLDVLDESMREGKLGEAVRNKLMEELVSRDVSALRYTGEAPLTLTYTPNVTAAPLGEISFSQVTIAVTGRAESANEATGLLITQASLQLRTVDMDFTVEYRGQSIAMHIQYRATCNVTGYNAANNTGEWTESWNIQQVG